MRQGANVPKPAAAESALGPAEFGRLLKAAFDGGRLPGHFAVACSGGPDSLALTLVAAEWARRTRRRLTALIVDHGLRPESAREARRVAQWLKARDIPQHVLRWNGPKPAANRQEAARDARYRLLADWCRRHEVQHILLGHHLQDQAETLLLRAARGSGVEGLAAMAPLRVRPDGLVLVRPLLGIDRARLAAALQQRGQEWIDDPSNQNPAFARVRVRQALALLGPDAEAARHLAQTAANMRRAARALGEEAESLLARAVAWHPAGFAWLWPAPWEAAPEENRLRALARLLGRVGGADQPPRLDGLTRAAGGLARPDFAGETLHRCRLSPAGDGSVLITREARFLPPAMALSRVLPPALPPGATATWDGRFQVCPQNEAANGAALAGFSLRPLGAGDFPGLAESGIPRAAWPGLPVLWRRGAAVAIPLPGLATERLPVILRFPAGASPGLSLP